MMAFAVGACVDVHLRPDAGGTGGDTSIGGQPGTGGDDTGTGGDTGAGGDTGTGGVAGAGGGGATGTGGHGGGGMSAGGSGAGGSGAGGSGAGGSPPDAGYDGPTGLTPNAAGQLVITEIMADTTTVSDDSGEWFEVYNPSTTETYDLLGCVLFDTNNSHEVTRHVVVAPRHFVTLARFGDRSGGFVPDYDYIPPACICPAPAICPAAQCVKFSNSGDRTGISCGIVLIDEVNFTTWLAADAAAPMVPHGRSYSLDPSHYSAIDNDTEANWCTGGGATPYVGSDFGTPGSTNPTCLCANPHCPY